jgi:hypothetical protein
MNPLDEHDNKVVWKPFFYAMIAAIMALTFTFAASAQEQERSTMCYDMDRIERDLAFKMAQAGVGLVSRTILDTPEAVANFFDKTEPVMSVPQLAREETAVIGLYKLKNAQTFVYLYFKDGCRVMNAVWSSKALDALLAGKVGKKPSGDGRPPALFGKDPNAHRPTKEYYI